MSGVGAVTAGVGVAVLTAGLGRLLLPRLPKPHPDVHPQPGAGSERQHAKANPSQPGQSIVSVRLFARLARPAFLLPVAVIAGVLAASATSVVDEPALPAWLVLSTVGVLAAGVDAATTWIPRHLCYLGWLAAAAATAVTAAAGWPHLGWMAVGVAVWTLSLWLVWRFAGGGFGDVRLAPIIGLAAGTLGLDTIVASLSLGAILVALHQLATRITGHTPADGVHAFAPGLVAGPYLALTVHLALTR